MIRILKNMINTRKTDTINRKRTSSNRKKNQNGADINVFAKIEDNKSFLSNSFKKSTDLLFHEFESNSGGKALIAYIDGLVNKDMLNRDVIHPFIDKFKDDAKKAVYVSHIKEITLFSDVIEEVLSGNTIMFVEGLGSAYAIDSKGWDKRSIDEPDVEAVIRGPKEGFVESIRVNTSLLRRKIKNNNLVIESLKLGKETKTDVAIAYIDGIVNRDVLLEVRRRLRKIDTDCILETGYIEQFIEDSPFSPLATVANTQKPDVVAGKLLEGRVAIFCDGTPHVLTVPHLFVETIQTSEDYYMRAYIASILRMLRLLAVAISILLPTLYVALTTYHQEMIPTVLLVSMAGAREGIPLPAFAEALLMVVMFELLRESGTRLPRPIGAAISIVGALVIGEAAVNAGLVSASMVIIIAITAVSSFIVPALTEVMTLYRLFFLFLGGTMGLYGTVCGVFVIVAHTVSLRSFGIPYASPAAPFEMSGMKDFGLRFPLWSMKNRPESIVKHNKKRQGKKERN